MSVRCTHGATRNRMATIHRHYGAWRVQIRRQGHKAISKTFELKGDADMWARETERSVQLGRIAPQINESNETLGDILKRYSREITPTKKSHTTEQYRIGALLRHAVSQRPLSNLKSVDMARFRDERLEVVSSATVRKELQLISHAITIATREWGIRLFENPCKSIRRPVEGSSRERRLDEYELAKLLEAAKISQNQYLAPVMEFAVETGMRRGELLSLRKDNVDLVSRVARLLETKNGSSREVPLSPRALDILKHLPSSTDVYVFPLTKESLRRTWGTACRRAGITNLRFHDLRHEATSRFFEHGLNVMEVASITGHRDLRMLKRYTHLKASNIALKLEQAFTPQ